MNKNVLATGGWPDMKKNPCPKNPNPKKTTHSFGEETRNPSGKKGEYLVTSVCKFCGAIIKDCPTIYV